MTHPHDDAPPYPTQFVIAVAAGLACIVAYIAILLVVLQPPQILTAESEAACWSPERGYYDAPVCEGN